MTKLCPRCKVHNVSPNSHFCIMCVGVFKALGIDIHVAANEYMFQCNDCGLLLEKDEKYCSHCGSANISVRTLVISPISTSNPNKKYLCDGCGNRWETSDDITCCPRCGSDRI